MNIEEAKHNLFALRLRSKNQSDIDALLLSIKSLDKWDKVIEEINEEITTSQFEDCECYPTYDYRLGLERAIEIIEKYKKEIEK